MRINVYSQELTDEVVLVSKDGTNDDGAWETFHAVRLMLHSPELLHFNENDDDRSGVTFWLPKSKQRRNVLAATFREMAMAVDKAPIDIAPIAG